MPRLYFSLVFALELRKVTKSCSDIWVSHPFVLMYNLYTAFTLFPIKLYFT